MEYAELILPEFDREMANTRKLLALIPDHLWDWKATPASPDDRVEREPDRRIAKCHSVGWNANHLLEIVGWIPGILSETSFDIAPVDGPPYESPNYRDLGQLLPIFDQQVIEGRAALAAASEAVLAESWSLLAGGQTLIALPRAAVIRTFVFRHHIHHRAHLCVYLKLNGVDVPGMYDV